MGNESSSGAYSGLKEALRLCVSEHYPEVNEDEFETRFEVFLYQLELLRSLQEPDRGLPGTSDTVKIRHREVPLGAVDFKEFKRLAALAFEHCPEARQYITEEDLAMCDTVVNDFSSYAPLINLVDLAKK